MQSFFNKRKSSSLDDGSTVEIKRGRTTGFTKENVQERIKMMQKNMPKGNWRRFGHQNIVYTELIQKWTHSKTNKSTEIWHICPWGMKKTVGTKLTSAVCKASVTVLPEKVKKDLNIDPASYNKDDISISLANTGIKNSKEFHRIFCDHCESNSLPPLIEKYKDKLQPSLTLENLISKWDELKVPNTAIDFVGCFISLNPIVQAGPNSRRFINRPTDHAKSAHPDTVSSTLNKAEIKRCNKVQSCLSTGKPLKVAVVEKPKVQCPTPTGQLLLTTKYNKKMKFIHINSTMQRKLGITEKCKDDTDKFAKGFCMSIVHTGVNKCLSNEAILETYDTAMSGMREYHKFLTTSTTGPLDITLSPPVEIAINKDNIATLERSILDGYRYDTKDSIYSAMKKSVYWGLMHDGISKFSIEYNGVFLRGVDDDFNPFVVPYCLTKMKGGVNAHDQANSLIENVYEFVGHDKTAFESISNYIKGDDDFPVAPPLYFKLGTLNNVDNDTIHIDVVNAPIGNCGDGVSVNEKAARVLQQLYGLDTPSFRCSAHAADGTLKRIARSETMCVEQVKSLYECLKTVIKHFASSCKSKELLDNSMAMLELKPKQLMAWCATRMAHFIEACYSLCDMLVPVYDTMYSNSLRKEDREKLFSSENLYVLMLLRDLRDTFSQQYLRNVDKTDVLVNTVYNTAQETAAQISTIATPYADAFLDGLSLDNNGNTEVEIKLHGNTHKLRLSNPHKPTRGRSEIERLNVMKDKLTDIKQQVIENMVTNIKDQCSEETNYHLWSGLDISDKSVSLDDRLNKLRDLFTLFCTEKLHTVQEYSNARETTTKDTSWRDHQVVLHYEAKINNCSPNELEEEFKLAWPKVNSLWIKETNDARKQKQTPSQLSTLKAFINNHATQYPNVVQFILIMIATPPNTSPLERAYSFLEMVCSKRRNRLSSENIETLFLLATLKLPIRSANDYSHEIKRLESK